MKRILKNVSAGELHFRDLGLKMAAGTQLEIEFPQVRDFISSQDLITSIQDGDVQVGDGTSFYTDALESELYLRTMFDDDAYLIDGTSLDGYTPVVVTDPTTGVKSTAQFMNILTMMRELYNDPAGPIYDADHVPVLGSGGWAESHAARILSIETALAKGGWYTQASKEWAYQKPLGLLIYYGWPNAFNSAVNGWDNEKVAQEMSKYRLVVFGNGLELATHGDHTNLIAIVARIKALNPRTQIFGYATVNQTLSAFETQVDNWKDNIDVDGIFMDEAGYDYGKTRSEFNDCVDYVHDEDLICFANAWNMNHVLGTANDTSYPNTTYNSGEVESNLLQTDWYLMESLAVNTLSYTGDLAAKADFVTRVNQMTTLRATYGINVAGGNVILDTATNGQDLFDFAFIAGCIASLEAVGSSDEYYGSSSAKSKFWDRPDVSEIGRLWSIYPLLGSDANDADKVLRFLDFGKLTLDFSSGAIDSEVSKY